MSGPKSGESGRAALERGGFSDGRTEFKVRASSSVAPDSFQVHTEGNPVDIVLIVSGLNTGHLHATWGGKWRGATPEWKVWFEDAAFKVFYTGRGIGVRFCDG